MEYRRDLDDLRQTVGCIPEAEHLIRFWEGADLWIQAEWLRDRWSTENSAIDDLETVARDFERSADLVAMMNTQTTNGSDPDSEPENSNDDDETLNDSHDTDDNDDNESIDDHESTDDRKSTNEHVSTDYSIGESSVADLESGLSTRSVDPDDDNLNDVELNHMESMDDHTDSEDDDDEPLGYNEDDAESLVDNLFEDDDSDLTTH
jgi:hypothetical protein